MLTGILRRHGLAANQLGMVGDRLYTDMALARAAGAMGILVLSGEATREEAEAMKPAPDLIVAHVGELSEKLTGDREVSRC
jgi:NagD protein